MNGRIGRAGLLMATLLLALPVSAWAGSTQAGLAVGVVVPARCAVRTPGSVASTEVPASVSRESLGVRCTKGTLPAGTGVSSTSVGPRISRDLLLTAGSAAVAAPRPQSEAGTLVGGEALGPRLVITINF
jgi:hypothetical protein